MKLEITPCSNGFYLEFKYPDDEDQDEKHVCKNVVELLENVMSEFESTSRHDDVRTYIIQCPGDKSEKFTSEHGAALDLLQCREEPGDFHPPDNKCAFIF